jgi:glycerol uptake facilitator-like aquaporin
MVLKYAPLQQHAAEFAGTAMLVAAVVGSGIMGERLAAGNAALALLANSIATGAVLFALIVTFAPISGAHFNPLVSLGFSRAIAQVLGGLVGVAVANLMFDLPAFSLSQHPRQGFSQLLAEVVATFGLLTVIRLSSSAAAIAAYIAGAYWFTASTSFANPAVTIARGLTNTFSGILPTDIPAFLAAQAAGAAAAILFCNWMMSGKGENDAH